MANKILETQFLYYAVVLDVNDPMMLGRIRARVLTKDQTAAVAAQTNPPFNVEKDAWTERDPFVFSPLLPYFIYAIPKVDELIYVYYYNNQFQYQNQFYIQALFTSPTTSPFEYFEGYKFNGKGGQFKTPKPLKDKNNNSIPPLSFGVFPEPGDNAILGRNSADLVIKENDVILRAGKNLGQITWNNAPAGNNGRAFLQLSRFDNLKILDDIKEFTESKENVVLVKYLIEWVITNPENQFDRFTGTVYLYKLKPDRRTNSAELKVDSDVEEFKSPVSSWGFNALTKKETIDFINNFIKTINNGTAINGRKIINESPFPVFYRPSNKTYSFIMELSNESLQKPETNYWSYGGYSLVGNYLRVVITVLDKATNLVKITKNTTCSSCDLSKKEELWKQAKDLVSSELEVLNIENVILPTVADLLDLNTQSTPTSFIPPLPVLSSDSVARKNLSDIFRKIKLNNTTTTNGYGLIYKKDEVGQPFDAKTIEVPIFKNTGSPVTFGALGADRLVLISHQSSKVGQPKINMDGTLYGISNETYTDEILPKTSATVRGEELLELLNYIVRFLITHTHAFPGLPPIPVTQDGSNVQTLLSEMQNAVNKILNENIRIN